MLQLDHIQNMEQKSIIESSYFKRQCELQLKMVGANAV